MRYHYEKPSVYTTTCGAIYCCDHPVYSRCTLFKLHEKGLAVVQQYSDDSKRTRWDYVQPWIAFDIYHNESFMTYLKQHADYPQNGIYPTVTVRKLMWSLRMKPIKKQIWETTFDRRFI